jgi:hypothetical protein
MEFLEQNFWWEDGETLLHPAQRDDDTLINHVSQLSMTSPQMNLPVNIVIR